MSDPITHSCLSINTAMDDSEHLNQGLWDSLCRQLKKYFIEKLHKMPVAEEEPQISSRQDQRLRYVQSLTVLFPTLEVWTSYRSM